MSETFFAQVSPSSNDIEEYERGFRIFLEACNRMVAEFAAMEYDAWQDLVDKAEAESYGLPWLALLHAKLKDIDRLDYSQQVQLLMLWDKAKDNFLSYLEAV